MQITDGSELKIFALKTKKKRALFSLKLKFKNEVMLRMVSVMNCWLNCPSKNGVRVGCIYCITKDEN